MRTLKDIEKDVTVLQLAHSAKVHVLSQERESIINEAWPTFDVFKHKVNTSGWAWDCPDSPFGFCAYDRFEDPCSDYCLFCGDPEERK